jgi:hypothetical protein
MAPADDDTIHEQVDGSDGLFRRPVRVPVPGVVRRAAEAGHLELAGKIVSATARILVVVLPAALAVVGLAVALAGAALSSRDGTEAIGTLGLEVGAAMWFAGAVTLGARPGPTVLRIALLVATGVGGLSLIGVALVAGWSGVGLDVAMEFGVGAVAVVVLDFIILGVLQARLDRLTANPWASAAPSSFRCR